MRKPFQGVLNIIRFNWHFYLLALGFLILLLLSANFLSEPLRFCIIILCLLILGLIMISLVVSLYVYDFSGLYQLNWLDEIKLKPTAKIVNINAGFDETSTLLRDKFKDAELEVLNFYDPSKHTEVSIKRAIRAYPSFPGTVQITTSNLPLADETTDYIFLILAAHEIRDVTERNAFFQELHRVLKPSGKIIVTEHLRDLPNLLAYNIGFFHFHSKASWQSAFQNAALKVVQTKKITPFITTFILEKHGIAT